MDNPILVDVWRGSVIESSHRGRVAVLDADGGVVFAVGDIDVPVFSRSAIKAIQALPLIESGAAAKYNLSDAEIALACASHSGEVLHTLVAESILAKTGLDLNALECGCHWPMGDKAAKALAASGNKPNALHNNCSGKHSGFLCVCCADDKDIKGYVNAQHFIQREVRAAMQDVTGAPHTNDVMGIDGCSIPTYAIPLRAMALGFAKLGSGQGLSTQRAKAAKRILQAIAAAPEMIAGEGRFDTEVMQLLGADIMIKMGAEGVYCGTIPALGLGIALKCDDGTVRAAEVMMAAIIRKFVKNDIAQGKAFEPYIRPVIKNWNGIEVSRLTPAAMLTN